MAISSALLIVSLSRLSLNTMTLTVTSYAVYTSQGVNITVTGIAQVRQPYIATINVENILEIISCL